MNTSIEKAVWPWQDPSRRLSGVAYWMVLILSGLGLLATVNQIFSLALFGFLPLVNSYYYMLIGLFLPVVFIAYPMRKRGNYHVNPLDWLLSLFALMVGFYFAANATNIITSGWDYEAPLLPTICSGVLVILALEAVRRCGGPSLLVICAIFAVYPLFADSMPGVLWGTQYTVPEAIRGHAMGAESIIGIPMRVVADLLIGFIVFGAALSISGGGNFFMQLAYALMGSRRGGPAKVSILSSGFFGSLSGSAVSNVLSTGVMTIPTMKRYGYSPAYAGAIEACASTGGTLMPPVMGAVAFIMASFLNISYTEVIIAALVPAVLFYLVLFLQADAYAARRGLKGLPKSELPPLRATLLAGWVYLLSLGLLVYLLLAFNIESKAPFYASMGLAVTAIWLARGRGWFGVVAEMIVESGTNIANLIGILAGIGLVVGAMSMTGVGTAFARELVELAGTSIPLLLGLGALTCFILGMGMTVSACYIFLAIVLAPALVQVGLNEIASHLFILYWGMLSYITPPVALAAVAASGIAKESAMKTAFTSVRLGIVLFILPFLFVINPALILQGSFMECAVAVVTATVAVWMFSAAFERYAYFIGGLQVWQAALFLTGGALLMIAEGKSDLIGLAMLIGLYLFSFLTKKRTPIPVIR